MPLHVTQWICVFLITKLGYCYVNLSRKQGTTVSQSSTIQGFSATIGNDGDITQIDFRRCTHTEIRQSIAWFQVDLGDQYSLKSVTIYYRNEANWPPYRFRQFYLDVSNGSAASTTTLTSQRVRCYKDNTTAPATPPALIDIPCKQTARYVIVETTYSAQEAIALDVPGPVLEICEIEVYGCEVGRYGESCLPCDGCSSCDITSGTCTCDTCVNAACTSSTRYCTNGCIKGYWGHTCTSRCNQHCLGNTCEQGHGRCTNGCVDFYYGYTCDQQCGSQCNPRTCGRVTGVCSGCISGYWGNICASQCNQHCSGNMCEQGNGTCTNGCVDFYYGYTCERQCGSQCNPRTCDMVTGVCRDCNTGFWGNTCKSQCNQHCLGNTCEQKNGTCTHGCADFYYGYTCEHQCVSQCNPRTCDRVTGMCIGCITGFYGPLCNKTCSPYCTSGSCVAHNGHCIGGCKENWIGDLCDKCVALRFGSNCSEECSVHCKGGVCNNVTGSCSDGCETGYYKDTCNRTCNPGCKDGCNKNSGYCDHGCADGRFGMECYDLCSVGCTSNCDRVTGNCVCKRGWQGARCTECSPTFYGASCEMECSPYCYNGTCHVNNGSCIGGCTGDYTGDKCTRGQYDSSTENPETAIGAGVGASILAIIVVVVGVVMFRLRRKKDGISEAQTDQRKESSISYEKEQVAFKNENRKDHSLLDARLYSNERPTNMEAQEVGLYETIDSENVGNKINENDLSKSYVNAKTIASVTSTTNDDSAEYRNVYLTINENQRSNCPYEELRVQN